MESNNNYEDEYTYIIYDKSSEGYHSFDNIYTLNITIDYLNNKNIPFINGKKAIEDFNNNENNQYKIDVDLNFDVYDFRYYEFVDKELSGIIDKLCVAMLVINNSKFKLPIYNEEFVKEALRYHKQYELEYIKHINLLNITNEKTRQEYVIDYALEPKNKILIKSDKQPSCLNKKFKLKPHQHKNLKWWTTIEKHPEKIYYSDSINYEIQIGELFYDPRFSIFKNIEEREYIKFNGGMLIDVVGTGKTLSAIISCVKNPVKKIKYLRHGRINSKATLIICPSQVAKQWAREIKRFINPKKIELTVYTVLGKLDLDKLSYQDLLEADFVITSQSFWNNENFLKTWLSNVYKKTYLNSIEYNFKTVNDILNNKRKELYDNPKKLENKVPILLIIDWYRIIIDEIHEPFTDSKLLFLKRIINHLNAKYKWGLSGTPFDKGNCINDMVQFVTIDNKKNTQNTQINNDIYNCNKIYNHLTTNFFSRHINDNGSGLKKLTEKIIWLNFSKTESMIYNAFIANPTIDKYGIEARQLCCHPQLVEQLNGGVFDACKTMSDMENVMIIHYKNKYDKSKEKISDKKEQIKNNKNYLIGLTYRQQKRFLKKLGYNVIIKYPDWYEGDNDNDSDNDSDSDDDDKEKIIVSEDTQKKVINIVKHLWHERAIGIDQTTELIKKEEIELKNLEIIMNGEKISYDFFKNMLDKIKDAQENKLDKDDSDYDSELEEEDGEMCSICKTIIDPCRIGMVLCGHTFHYECIMKIISNSKKCPLCSKVINKDSVFLISHEKEEYNTKGEMIGKSGLVDLLGTKLANMICYLMSIEDSVIIFSQWDGLLRKVGNILNQFGIPNRFCKGNVHMRDKAIRDFMDSKDIRAIMLSSKSTASGANMTKATKILFLDPIFGTPEYITNTEWQAIGRAYRMGQENDVEIVRFITNNTVEEDIYKKNIEDRKTSISIDIDEIVDDKIVISNDKLKIINKYVEQYKKQNEIL
jgi:SNF2 family DNA or RNA helicase